MSHHKGSGQALVRFVEHREGKNRGPVRDVYLGVYGSEGAGRRYEEEIRHWIERSIRVGWCPEGWQPARTGHAGVLTVGEVAEGFAIYLNGTWGAGWRDVEVEDNRVCEYREALGQAWQLLRAGRRRGNWDGDRETLEEGKRLRREARQRYGHLDEGLYRLLTARVLLDLHDDFGPVAAAAFGDREIRRLRARWDEQGLALRDRKAGMEVVSDAFYYVIGRGPSAPWNKDRSFLESHSAEYGLDCGIVGADGRWLKLG